MAEMLKSKSGIIKVAIELYDFTRSEVLSISLSQSFNSSCNKKLYNSVNL